MQVHPAGLGLRPMSGTCIEPGWRWRAFRDTITDQPRLVALGVVGTALLITGIAVESASLGAAGILGGGLLAGSLVLPMVTKLSIGTYLGIERDDDEAGRDEKIAELTDRVGPTLLEVAARVDPSSDPATRLAWAHQALVQSYHDTDLVPRSQREIHAVCLVLRRVRAAVGPDVAVAGVRVPFEERAAWALVHLGYDLDAAAAALHREPVDVDELVQRAKQRAQATDGTGP